MYENKCFLSVSSVSSVSFSIPYLIRLKIIIDNRYIIYIFIITPPNFASIAPSYPPRLLPLDLTPSNLTCTTLPAYSLYISRLIRNILATFAKITQLKNKVKFPCLTTISTAGFIRVR